MGIVSVSQKKGYVIAKWAMLVLGCLFLLFGAVTLATSGGSANIKPEKITLTAAGLAFDPATGYYNVDVYKKETAIMVNTSPLGSSRLVTFTIEEGDDCLTVTSGIWPGSYATLTLKGDSNKAYQFGRTVKIMIKSGQIQEFLNVNIILPPDQIRFDFKVINELTDLELLNGELRASAYIKEVYSDYSSSGSIAHTKTWSSYMFVPKFSVLGGEIRQPTEAELETGNTAGRAVISSVTQGIDDGVRLFGVPRNSSEFPDLPNGFRNIYIPIRVLQSVLESKNQNASKTVRFMITSDYLGKQYIDFFELKIVK